MERARELERRQALRKRASAWQKAAVGLLAVSVVGNTSMFGLYQKSLTRWNNEASKLRREIARAEETKEQAVRELGAMALSQAREELARREQAQAYEAIGDYQYIGTCTVTAYCACEECCGEYADGLTATGLPVREGIVAVDPEVIPLGSTIIMDGVKYLAADTGVTGNHIDIYIPHHKMASAFGKHWMDVWVVAQ